MSVLSSGLRKVLESACVDGRRVSEGACRAVLGSLGVAGERVPGMTAEEYILQSVVDPDAFTVEGYPEGQMLDDYEERLTAGELEAMVAYLMTLTEADS